MICVAISLGWCADAEVWPVDEAYIWTCVWSGAGGCEVLVAGDGDDNLTVAGVVEDTGVKDVSITSSGCGGGTNCETRTCVSFCSVTEAGGSYGVGFNSHGDSGIDVK